MASYDKMVSGMRQVFQSGKTRVVEWRREQMLALLRLLDEQSEALCQALMKDLRKHKNESLMMEVNFVKNELIHLLDHLDEYTGPQKCGKNLMTMMDGVYIQPEPFGTVLIMGAWNYPIQLTLGPLCGAIAAGNCVVIKPSELTEATCDLLEKIVPQYMDPDCVKVVNGGVTETTALLKERFDYILYTGSTQVAKIIYEAAAKYLTPVTLELGGKSPVYIDRSSDLTIAARRIMWGRFTNCGQTCIAPDYVMCAKDLEPQFVEKCREALVEFFGESPQNSDSYGRIVNNRHFNRVKNLISSGKVAIGGQTNEEDNYIAPTVLVDVQPTDPAMQEEIFGPVLPIMTVRDEDEAISFINAMEKPLALYVFSKDQKVVDKVLARTSSGGVTINDTVMHASVDTLPFGGVGHSGMGAYHGRFSFDTFTHKRACLVKKQAMEAVNKVRYPPYTEKKLNFLSFVMNKKPASRGGLRSWMYVIVVGVILGLVLKGIFQ